VFLIVFMCGVNALIVVGGINEEAQTKDLDCLMSTYEAIPDYGVEKFLKGEKDFAQAFLCIRRNQGSV